ncbi:MAG: hypothetical protein R3F62_26445 [Planctomycetota bacterium]
MRRALDPADLRLPRAPRSGPGRPRGRVQHADPDRAPALQALAGGGDSAALAVALRATLATPGDRELRAPGSPGPGRPRQSPVLATAEVEEAVRALAAR